MEVELGSAGSSSARVVGTLGGKVVVVTGAARGIVVFLASDAARMVSGTSLAVTGGDSANVTS